MQKVHSSKTEDPMIIQCLSWKRYVWKRCFLTLAVLVYRKWGNMLWHVDISRITFPTKLNCFFKVHINKNTCIFFIYISHKNINFNSLHATSWGYFYWYELNSIPAWICNYMPKKVSGQIIYPFPNFNGCAVEVWEWISYSTHTL